MFVQSGASAHSMHLKALIQTYKEMVYARLVFGTTELPCCNLRTYTSPTDDTELTTSCEPTS
jgi:hypothetical protein